MNPSELRSCIIPYNGKLLWEKTFTNSHKTSKFAKCFYPESFPLYCIRKSVHFELTHTQCYSSGIPTLVVAGASIDVVISISLFGVFLGLVFSDGEW